MNNNNWTEWDEQVFQMIGRNRRVEEGSRAAAVVGKECQMIVSNNPDRSRFASVTDTGINKAKVIAEFIFSH